MSARLLLSAALVAVLSYGKTAISAVRCDPDGPGRYRISYSSPGSVRIFASHSPDAIDPKAPVITAAKSPASFSLPDFTGRPYFHIKPASGPPAVVSIRRLPLEGQDNFRDLGGYLTIDGGSVRWGKLYRSGQLSGLTAKDLEYLRPLGIRLVCDFRAITERERQPDRWPGGPELLSAPIGDDPEGRTLLPKFDKVFLNPRGPAEVRAVMLGIYGDLVQRAAPRYSIVFRRLLAGGTPSMVHCTSGKDRTGVFDAVLLTILGVPRQTVTRDYLLSNDYLLAPDKVARSAATIQKQYNLPALPSVDVLAPMIGVEAVYLETVWRSIGKQWGSFDEFRRKALGLSDQDVLQLKKLYVANP